VGLVAGAPLVDEHRLLVVEVVPYRVDEVAEDLVGGTAVTLDDQHRVEAVDEVHEGPMLFVDLRVAQLVDGPPFQERPRRGFGCGRGLSKAHQVQHRPDIPLGGSPELEQRR